MALAVLFAVPIGCYAQIEEEILQSKGTKIAIKYNCNCNRVLS